MSNGRPKINRELEALRSRLEDVNAGLLACYETIAMGQQKKTRLEAAIVQATSRSASEDLK